MTGLIVYFAFPGSLDTPTGGYIYDRRLIEELCHLGMQVEPIPLPPYAPDEESMLALRAAARAAFASLADDAIVVIDGLAFGILDELASQEADRLRLVALCHHPLALETGLEPAQRQSLFRSERSALKSARTIVVTSEHTRKILLSQFGLAAEDVTVARPGSEPSRFADCTGNPIRLLCVASLVPRKGHDLLLAALSSLTSLPWLARCVGSMDLDPAWAAGLVSQARELGLGERIEFVGTSDDIQAEYQQADIFVLPSRFEGYGMVFAEALAAGLPIVAARAGAVPEVVPESAGLLVAVDDSAALAAAMRQLLSQEALRRDLQTGARLAAASLPSWADSAAIVARKLEELSQQ